MSARGFTLIETLVAVTILTLAVVAPLYVANRAIVSSQIARDQLVASYLAQEGIEYVRTMRDHEFLVAYSAGGATVSNDAWDAFASGSGSGSIASCITTTCTLDPAKQMGTGSGFALTSCSGNACGLLYLSNGVYTQQSDIVGSSVTPFVRTIQATPASTNDMRIVSTVAWTSRGTPYTVSVYDHLVPWQ
ncbi:MAG: prepilin-type N-terminal cleavage/methylation domain-containing protein [bacterium]|nr:prepilin-type N-terminal cleavage/methylation domain-containing protein [bacterium]